MATLININGDYITQGLQGRAVCDEAVKIAKSAAADRNEVVYIEDDGEYWAINPDGSYGDVPDWVIDG